MRSNIIKWLDNLKFTKKMMIIYVFCFFIPTAAMSAFFSMSISERVNHENQTIMAKNLEKAEQGIESYFEWGTGVLDRIYLTENIYDILNRDVTHIMDRIEQNNDLSEILSVYNVSSSYTADTLRIYTDDRGFYQNRWIGILDEAARNEDWYRTFKKENENMVFYTEADQGGKAKVISIIRRMDHYKTRGREVLIKMDLSVAEIQKILERQPVSNSFYLLDASDRVVYPEGEQLWDKSPINEKDYIEADIGILKGWKLRGIWQSSETRKIAAQELGRYFCSILIFFLITLAILLLVSRSISRRLEIMMEQTKKMENNVFEETDAEGMGNDEIGFLSRALNKATVKIRNLIEENYRKKLDYTQLQLENQRAELNMLHSQINPHFLFNIFEALRMRSMLKEEYETAHIIKLLAGLFRRSLTWEDGIVTVEEEISFIKEYIEIQKYRFFDNLKTDIQVDPEAMKIRIPKFMLLVSVENSCMHGMSSGRDNKISIKMRLCGNGDLQCIVEDNGRGMDAERLEALRKVTSADDGKGKKGKIGILNVKRRLELYFGDGFTYDIQSRPGEGTTTTIVINRDKLQKYAESEGDV